MRRIIALILSVSPLLASAEQWYEDAKLAGSRPDIGSSDGFGAMIIMTTDAQQALRNWEKPTAGVHLPEADIVEKGRPIEALIVFAGCKPNVQGNCVVEADYKILKPDGSVYASYEGTEVWRNKPVIPAGKIGLSVGRVGLIAEPEDPLGEYQVQCTVREAVGKTELTISSTFLVVEAGKRHQPNPEPLAE